MVLRQPHQPRLRVWPHRLDRDGGPPIKGRFVVWDPDRFLVMTWEAEHPSLVRLWLQEEDAGASTVLILEHRLFAPDASNIVPFDWDGAIERLKSRR